MVIYPYWLLLIFNGEFLFWTIGLIVSLLALAYVFVFWITHWVIILLVAGAITTYVLKWARIFLVRMIIDYDANNSDGRVIIERLLPHPTLPETVQFPLQQAAQGSPEVNTKGVINTLISQLKGLKFLRGFTIGDLTLRGPAAPFGITMYSIKDPAGVKAKLEADWKKIETIKSKKNAERERKEEIDRMTIAVSEGIVKGFVKVQEELNLQSLPPVVIVQSPQVPPPSPFPPPEPSPMPWPPIESMPTAAERAGPRPAQPASAERPPEGDAPSSEQLATAEASSLGKPVDPSVAPLGSTELAESKSDLSPAPGAESAPPPEHNSPEHSGQKP